MLLIFTISSGFPSAQYDLAPETDMCINREKSKKIIVAVTIGHKSGPICVNRFNSNQIQLDAAINSGSSGGPIVNEDADLVATAK